MEEEISLRELIEILIKGKKTIIVITAIAILLSGILSFFVISPTYEANTMLMVAPIAIPTPPGVNGVGATVNGMLQTIEIPLRSYQEIVVRAAVLKHVIDKVGDPTLTVEKLKKSISVQTDKDSNLLRISVQAKSPEEAEKIAGILVNEFLYFVKERNLQMINDKFEIMEMEYQNRYKSALQEVADLEKQLAEQPKTIVLKRSIMDDPNLRELAATLGRTDVLHLKGLKMESEEINPAYDNIEQRLINARVDVNQLNVYQQELAQTKTQLEAIINNSGANIYSITPPYASPDPVKPRKLLNMAIAGMLGLMISVFIVFFKEYWQNSAPQKTTIQG